MTVISIKLTIKELELLTALASDQLFRREFIDPKLPGFRSNASEIGLGKALVARLRLLLDPGSMKKPLPERTANPAIPASRALKGT